MVIGLVSEPGLWSLTLKMYYLPITWEKGSHLHSMVHVPAGPRERGLAGPERCPSLGGGQWC